MPRSIYLVGRLYFIHRSDIISYWTIAAVVCIIESIRTPEIETEQDFRRSSVVSFVFQRDLGVVADSNQSKLKQANPGLKLHHQLTCFSFYFLARQAGQLTD